MSIFVNVILVGVHSGERQESCCGFRCHFYCYYFLSSFLCFYTSFLRCCPFPIVNQLLPMSCARPLPSLFKFFPLRPFFLFVIVHEVVYSCLSLPPIFLYIYIVQFLLPQMAISSCVCCSGYV